MTDAQERSRDKWVRGTDPPMRCPRLPRVLLQKHDCFLHPKGLRNPIMPVALPHPPLALAEATRVQWSSATARSLVRKPDFKSLFFSPTCSNGFWRTLQQPQAVVSCIISPAPPPPPQRGHWLILKDTGKPAEIGNKEYGGSPCWLLFPVPLGPILCPLGHAHSMISTPPLLGPPVLLAASAVSMTPLAGELILMSKID